MAEENRNIRRQNKILEWENRISMLHQKYPRLEEITGLHTQMALELALLGLGKGKMGMCREELEKAMRSLQDEKRRILRDNKLPENAYQILWDCPHCEDRGYLSPGIKCSCLLQEEIREHFQWSGLASEQENQTFQSFSLDWYDDKKRYANILEVCQDFAEGIARRESAANLVLTGDVGTGKTHLCSAIANYVLESGKTVIYIRISRLLDLIREFKFNLNFEKMWNLQYLERVDLLIIDDLGTETITDFSKEQLLSILDERINNHRPWVISTNLSTNEIGQHYEDRISDRITGNATILKFVGESVRLRKRVISDSV